MRLSTRLIRTPFGASNAHLSSRVYGDGDPWTTLKEQFEGEHRTAVAGAILSLPGPLFGVTAGYRDNSGTDYDGRQAEWWSVIAYDGPPE